MVSYNEASLPISKPTSENHMLSFLPVTGKLMHGSAPGDLFPKVRDRRVGQSSTLGPSSEGLALPHVIDIRNAHPFRELPILTIMT